MSNLENIERRLDDIDRRISELTSSVATLADIVSIHENRHEQARQQADQDRALMLNLIQAIAQGQNGG